MIQAIPSNELVRKGRIVPRPDVLKELPPRSEFAGITVDGVFLLNLPRRPERLQHAQTELSKLDLDPLVFPAVDLRKILDRPEGHSEASFGCTVSHICLWKTAIMLGMNSILIAEDDLQIPSGFDLDQVLTSAPDDWDFLFPGWLVWKDRDPQWAEEQDGWGKLRNGAGTHFYLARNLKRLVGLAEEATHRAQIDAMMLTWAKRGIVSSWYLKEGQVGQGGFQSDLNHNGWNPGNRKL